MSTAMRENREPSEPSGSEYGSSPFSQASNGGKAAYSGFTTPESIGNVAYRTQATEDVAEKNLTLMSKDPFASYDGLPDKFHTCHHPYHSSYTEDNLPLLLFRLEPPNGNNSEYIGNLVENGMVVLDYQGNPVRNFPFLPRYISVKPSGWLIEFWMRSDTRLTYRDIKARMPVAKEELPSDNVLNMRRERDARKPLGLSCWTARRGGVTKAEVERVEQLSAENIMHNTALKVRCDLQPAVLESRSFYPNSTPQHYPLDTFLDNGNESHTPGRRLNESIELLFKLQVLAMDSGLDDWRNLPESQLPEWWAKSKSKGNSEVGNASQSQESSVIGSVLSTPKSAPRSRMSWKTPQKTGLSTASSAQTPQGLVTPQSVFGDTATTLALFTDSNAIEDSSNTYHYSSPGYDMATGDEMTAYSSPFNDYQSLPALGYHQLQTSPSSGMDTQGVDMNAMHNAFLFASNTFQQQDVFSSAASQGTMIDYSLFDHPFLFDCPIQNHQVDYTQHFGNVAMEGFHNHTSAYSSDYSPSAHRFNGNMGFSVRQHHDHKLNMNTGEVMGRNNPFPWTGRHRRNSSSQRSFENFLMEDLPF
ncbi:predicted protein [Uncinocarpus reesii 1704]|uniref:Uncharacterized protein n=1 Tax=Uncinocarpus reesii (strain UAMH 1704) TaxID=336963 RepID=C4JNF9_UNCRE|nr:uncharacterized protein UREG_04365 [Uncinocarpus reesii 1704]EEP79519.1 predicted protein [Uncinocarpus reesii 1704]